MTEKTPSKNKTRDIMTPRRSALSLELKHNLAQGDRGGQVEAAQEALIKYGYKDFKNDGRFGTMMSKAVRRFQNDHGLKVTGEINAATWEALFQSTTVKQNKE